MDLFVVICPFVSMIALLKSSFLLTKNRTKTWLLQTIKVWNVESYFGRNGSLSPLRKTALIEVLFVFKQGYKKHLKIICETSCLHLLSGENKHTSILNSSLHVFRYTDSLHLISLKTLQWSYGLRTLINFNL